MSKIVCDGCDFSTAYLEHTPIENANGNVIICPGGAYAWLSERESWPVARAFEELGRQAYILRYSVSPHPLKTLPLRELAWAIRRVREQNTGRVYICGFSAGGHLAASLGVHWKDAELFNREQIEAQRPDGLILCYPFITTGEFSHKICAQNLTGGDSAMPEYMSLEKHVGSQVPPTFMWHTAADSSVPVQNSLIFHNELLRYGVKCELHIFPTGNHGMSLATAETQKLENGILPDPHIAKWFVLCAEWMENADKGLYD